ncbi:hypothetical protein KCTCHS21_45920 [Cohnella abietis]|uniref:Uncharacterized protein n=1 Tax=Cohnella abietis TaxID=2507935 RepID=A0A3T1DAU2_9BACL|nr:hypothetical protein KCTCHS21_45920 [Cohnella abietis]
MLCSNGDDKELSLFHKNSLISNVMVAFSLSYILDFNEIVDMDGKGKKLSFPSYVQRKIGIPEHSTF